MQKRFEVGQIVNTFGIKGFVKVYPYVDDIKRFDNLKKVHIVLKKQEKVLEIEEVKYQKNMVLVKFKGIENVEEANVLRQAYVEIDREDAIPLEDGQYFIADLLGMEVYTEEGTLLGKVNDIFNTGSNDIYEIKDELGKQILLPGIPEVIKKVDLKGEMIIVHLLEGLI